MGRPKSMLDCIGIHKESNELMKKAWTLNLKHGDTVFLVKKGSTVYSEWKFLYFTYAGARLYSKDFSHRSCRYLVNWDKNEAIYNNIQEARAAAIFNTVSKITRAEQEVEDLRRVLSTLINSLEDKDDNNLY